MTRISTERASRRFAAGVAVALSLLCWSVQGAATATAGQRKTHTVTIEGTAFTPAALTVAAGDRVVWINKDPFPHTATANGKGGFDSGAIAPDKSWAFTAAKKGEFDYICALHPTMKARLTVE